MVKGKCYTDYREHQHCKWPTIFCENITIGDKVMEQGVDRGNAMRLTVLSITHSVSQNYRIGDEPFILIELGYYDDIQD